MLRDEARGGFFSVFQESANSPEVISNTPNRNLDTPKVIFVTLGVFLFYAERQNVPHILTFSLEMPCTSWFESKTLGCEGHFQILVGYCPILVGYCPIRAPYSY